MFNADTDPVNVARLVDVVTEPLVLLSKLFKSLAASDPVSLTVIVSFPKPVIPLDP